MANLLLAVLGVSLLMIVHEAGHYLCARAAGIRVLTFSIGFGPTLVRFRPRGSVTTFKVGLVPLLAFVQLAGANPFEENDPRDEGLYANKSLAARALTLAGGPLANYLFAAVVVFGLAVTGWREEVPTSPMKVAQVAPRSPAEAAGVHAGDVIVEADGKPVRDVSELGAYVSTRAGEPTTFAVVRSDGTRSVLAITPASTNGRGTIGVVAEVEVRSRAMSARESAEFAVALPWRLSVENAKAIADLVKRRSSEGLSGPVGMTKALATVANDGLFMFLLALVAVSVGLGWFNLLPLPFLDGGRLLFLALELATGRRPHQKAEAVVHAVGMLLFLGVAVAVTWRDIVG